MLQLRFVFPYDGLLHFLAPGAVFDTQNEVPTCAVGLGHHVTVNTMAFLSGLCVTNRTFKIEGLFYDIHCGPHLPSLWAGHWRGAKVEALTIQPDGITRRSA